jgi:signal transduction histidine kinase
MTARARVLVLAPFGRDARLAVELLGQAGIAAETVTSLAALASGLAEGADAAVVAEEAFGDGAAGGDTAGGDAAGGDAAGGDAAGGAPGGAGDAEAALTGWVAAQPAWSDLPFIVLTTGVRGPGGRRRPHPALLRLARDANVTFLERPFHPETFVAQLRAALRARARQYEASAFLDARARTAAALAASEARLEALVAQRTAALERANAQLVAEAAERAQAEARLRQSQKMEAVGQLTGGIAHDFNNLLTAVMGSLELIHSRTREERSRQLAGHGLAAVARGARLIRQLLTFSRVQRLELTAVDVSALVAGMRDLVEGVLAPDMTLQTELGEHLPAALADPHELELAVLNLAINARDAMPRGGTLRIATAARCEGGQRRVVVSVADTGTGMSAETMERVFEPFFTTKEVGRGSGLGLSQVYGLAQQSGGRVALRSTLGVGTTVEIVLPAAGAEGLGERRDSVGGRLSCRAGDLA